MKGVRRLGFAGAALILLGGAIILVARVLLPPATSTVDRYLAAWSGADYATMQSLVEPSAPALAPVLSDQLRRLGATSATFRRAGAVRASGHRSRAAFEARLQLAGLGEWRYRGTFDLLRAGRSWKVLWSPAAVHPALRPGLAWSRTRSWPARAPILDRNGTALVAAARAVAVGVVPSKVRGQATVLAALQRAAGVDPEPAAAALAAHAGSGAFLRLAVLPRPRFLAVDAQLRPLPGVFFAPVPGGTEVPSAAGILGTLGIASAAEAKRLGAPYLPGDVVGASGLEQAGERRLAGDPAGSVALVDAAGRTAATLFRFPGRAGGPLPTTLDLRVQQAALVATGGASGPEALVALDSATGGVVAAVSRPVGGFDRALLGAYPPGSTFKVVTASALLAHGLTPASQVACPPSVTVDGRTFRNFAGEQGGAMPFETAFAISCNAAFIGEALKLPAAALVTESARFGFGTRPSLPFAAVTGSVPPPASRVEQAADAIGQGRVTASPLQMATVAAAVDAGAWRAPVVLPGAPAVAPRPLDQKVTASLRLLLRAVVTKGTGTALARVPGPPVFGKTGTAEFGTATPPATHAWFIGYRAGLAFAVIVEGGGVGGTVAAPVAARFLTALGAAPVP